ncbi:sensor histidine kinase [Bacteroides sp. 224]|uniref:sensor histidine kinase n=1 Tax=Bacteroides sp. 224 TaxID=2302936 RepID=UPI0013D8D44C|nr:histidine kinase [Bacteroides sp. 224]NDV66315.1 histidine kinase [Bacteroides sp. 224]
MNKATPYHIPSFLFDDKYSLYRHLALQAVILLITLSIFFDAPDKLNLTINRFYGWISYYLFMNMLVYFNVYVLFPRFLAKNKIALYILSVIAFTLFSLFFMMILQDLFYDIGVTHQEEPSVMAIFLSITSSMLSIFLFLGGVSAFLLFKRWMTSNYRMNNLRLATSQSELNFLKSQINPHFLFNMINNANILVDEDPEMASSILVKLDDLLRYQLDGSTKDKVYLEADINFLTNFLELEKTRRDQFEYKINVCGDIRNVEVAPLLFIPFVENAVKHNSDNLQKSYIYISFESQADTLIFTCENSIPTHIVKKKDGGLGLANIKRRLDLLFDNKYTLEQIKTDTQYTVKLQLYI